MKIYIYLDPALSVSPIFPLPSILSSLLVAADDDVDGDVAGDDADDVVVVVGAVVADADASVFLSASACAWIASIKPATPVREPEGRSPNPITAAEN